jgi:uncharacterized membrane-anchored protein
MSWVRLLYGEGKSREQRNKKTIEKLNTNMLIEKPTYTALE